MRGTMQGKATVVRGPRYKIPCVYGDAVEKVIREQPNVKVANVEQMIIADLCLGDSARPSDFPTSQQIKNRVAAVKRRLKNEQRHAPEVEGEQTHAPEEEGEQTHASEEEGDVTGSYCCVCDVWEVRLCAIVETVK